MPQVDSSPAPDAEEIPVGFGLTVLVDADDARWLRLFRWKLTGTMPKWYVRAWIPAFGREVLMHRLVIEPPVGLVIDHINGDSLDNRKANLRACTQGENTRNRREHVADSIVQDRKSGLWIARIQVGERARLIGRFVTPEEASIEFQQALRKDALRRAKERQAATRRRGGRRPKPWYCAGRDAWITKVGNKKIILARGKENVGLAQKRFREVRGTEPDTESARFGPP